jgi:hypothetical protein
MARKGKTYQEAASQYKRLYLEAAHNSDNLSKNRLRQRLKHIDIAGAKVIRNMTKAAGTSSYNTDKLRFNAKERQTGESSGSGTKAVRAAIKKLEKQGVPRWLSESQGISNLEWDEAIRAVTGSGR